MNVALTPTANVALYLASAGTSDIDFWYCGFLVTSTLPGAAGKHNVEVTECL